MNLSIFVLMRMNARQFFIRAFVFAALLFSLTSCMQKFEDIRITSFDVISFSPKSLHSAEAVVSLGIDNPATSFTVSDFEMVIMNAGSKICTLAADTVSIEKQSSREYRVPCTARMESLSLGEMMGLAGKSDLSDFTADVSANVTTGKGKGRKVEFKDIKISDLIK